MAASETMIARVRRMTAEPTTTTYTDDAIAEYIEAYPVIDAENVDPTEGAWVPTYDLHAAAADIWEEKAANLALLHDFSADGGSYDRSQMYDMAMDKVRYHQARRNASSRPVKKWPPEDESFDSL